jgi:hypothetical protein
VICTAARRGSEGNTIADAFRKAIAGGVASGCERPRRRTRSRTGARERYLHLATHGFFSPAKRSELVVQRAAGVRGNPVPVPGLFGTVRMVNQGTVLKMSSIRQRGGPAGGTAGVRPRRAAVRRALAGRQPGISAGRPTDDR